MSPASAINGQLVEVILEGLEPCTGTDCFLKGRFADLVALKSPSLHTSAYPDANEPSRKYLYDLPDARVGQVMVYRTIDSFQRYLHSLGFRDDNTVPNGIRGMTGAGCTYPPPTNDYCPTRANAHWDLTDRSFYSPSDDTLHFGDGGIPDAEDADIIAHEYGHAIQYWQYPSWGCSTGSDCEMRAMGEGFGDYLAASFHAADGDSAYQQSNAGCVGEWDSSFYSGTQPPCLRRVDGSKIYPNDLQADRYKDSEIWSRALWDIRAAVGANIALQLILEHHYLLLSNSSMTTAALRMIDVDAELFGGANEAALLAVFCARGILPAQGCAPPTNTKIEVLAIKDASVRQDGPNTNDGNSPRLRLMGLEGKKRRVLVGLPTELGVDADNVKSAVLELTIAESNQDWSRFGRAVDAHPVPAGLDFWEEGNGVAAGAPQSQWTRGTVPGVTWNCPVDTKTDDTVTQCSNSPTAPPDAPSLPWLAGSSVEAPFGRGAATAPVVQTNGMTGKVRWAVTADLKAGVRSWAIKTAFDWPGVVDYYSIEGAQASDPLDQSKLRPRLVITLN